MPTVQLHLGHMLFASFAPKLLQRSFQLPFVIDLLVLKVMSTFKIYINALKYIHPMTGHPKVNRHMALTAID